MFSSIDVMLFAFYYNYQFSSYIYLRIHLLPVFKSVLVIIWCYVSPIVFQGFAAGISTINSNQKPSLKNKWETSCWPRSFLVLTFWPLFTWADLTLLDSLIKIKFSESVFLAAQNPDWVILCQHSRNRVTEHHLFLLLACKSARLFDQLLSPN